MTGLDLPGRRLHNGIIWDNTERKKAEAALLELNESLERRVEDRTAELSQANLQLQAEITERKRAAHELAILSVQFLSLFRQAGMAEVAAGVVEKLAGNTPEIEAYQQGRNISSGGHNQHDSFSCVGMVWTLIRMAWATGF